MKTGEQLRDEGMKASLNHAESVNVTWGSQALNFLIEYAKKNEKFLAEDVRMASLEVVPEPPSNRAWGSVISKARKEGFITKIGYKEVSNPKAHKTPAAYWKSNL